MHLSTSPCLHMSSVFLSSLWLLFVPIVSYEVLWDVDNPSKTEVARFFLVWYFFLLLPLLSSPPYARSSLSFGRNFQEWLIEFKKGSSLWAQLFSSYILFELKNEVVILHDWTRESQNSNFVRSWSETSGDDTKDVDNPLLVLRLENISRAGNLTGVKSSLSLLFHLV